MAHSAAAGSGMCSCHLPTKPFPCTRALYPSSSTIHPPSSSSLASLSCSHGHCLRNSVPIRSSRPRGNRAVKGLTVKCAAGGEPLKVMISGAPASGKGTQCEMIVKKYGLVHISTGDLLRAEVSSATEIGKKAKEYMDSGRLVPDEIVTDMVISRLSREDVKEKGWLLDGYPRSRPQAESLERLKIRPDIYVVLEVPDEILIDRCVGRRMDPVTGKIYHVKNFLPETEEIKARLIIRTDDTPEKVKSRLETYKQNAESIVSTYLDVLKKEKWRGIPTRLNNIPHSREIREYFYKDVVQATQRAVEDKRIRLKVEINIPELNPEMDVYRIGSLMELVRALALSFADDGKHVKVCVQGSMGEGALAGMPLQLAGSRRILEFMDWGDDGAIGTFVNIGSIGNQVKMEVYIMKKL
ncbi:hypothetical protein Taro_038737 [Colocasia esculenta]|uniref:adenylate kinase n=1 Tax=Colocasia esculenta TaxID=4460 RepID=A0A843WTJ7_COLES|nr:hypothetical protein [Colocasia esculenta]